jgi:hypothetical protein
MANNGALTTRHSQIPQESPPQDRPRSGDGGGPDSSALLRLLRLSDVARKTQKSCPISEPFLVKNLEKRRVKCVGVSAVRDDFCLLLVGPPSGARKSKTLAARAPGERRRCFHRRPARSTTTTQFQLARRVGNCVAKNVLRDKMRHATQFNRRTSHGVGSLLPPAIFH